MGFVSIFQQKSAASVNISCDECYTPGDPCECYGEECECDRSPSE